MILTTCKYFDLVGNRCSRVTDGKCNDLQDCEFKYIAELKAENERLKEENYQLQKGCQICENFIDFIPCKPIRDMDYDLQKVINQRDKYYKQTLDDEIQINELMQENERLKQTLQEIENVLSWVDSSSVWYNGQKAYTGDELIEFLKSRIINIINSTKAEEE